MKLHHVGLVTKNIQECSALYEALGYSRSTLVYDPIQMASIALMHRSGETMIELIAPEHSQSPAHKWLKRIKAGTYHLCYETGSLPQAIGLMHGLGFVTVMDPVPAVAFEDRQVAFLWSALTGLVEIVESVRVERNRHSGDVEELLLAQF